MRLCRPGGLYAPIPQNGRPHPRRLSVGDSPLPQAGAHRGFGSSQGWRLPLASASEAYRCRRPRFRVAPRAKIRFKAVQQARARRAPLMAPTRKPRNREEMMVGDARLIQLASAAIGAYALLVGASASAEGVKIGILNDQSGVYADYGGKGSVEAAKMAIEDFGGSVLGQTIDLVTADHQNKPDLAGNIARRWYDAEGVDMITDLTTSSA